MKWWTFSFAALLMLRILTTNVLAQQAEQGISPQSSAALNAGVTAFKAGHYDQAIVSFKQAVQFDSSNDQARLYLGIVYSYQVIPNLDTPENLAVATQAIQQFDLVLKHHPEDLTALKQEASIYRNTRQLEKAKTYYRRAASLDPDDPITHYTIAVTDWQQAYGNSVKVLAQEGLRDDGEGNLKLSRQGCETLRAQNAALVDDAFSNLKQAIALNPAYDDAMQYLNLTYRRNAELRCGDKILVDQDLQQADQWTQKAMQARKAASQKHSNQ